MEQAASHDHASHTFFVNWLLDAQVVWRRAVREGAPIPWSRYVWRRGSVPLWWGVFLKQNGLGEAEIKIKEQRTFRGSRRWGARGAVGVRRRVALGVLNALKAD